MPGSSPALRSPFRFAGGKSWLIPRLRWWLLTARPTFLLEPFAGGGGVSVMAVSEGLVPRAQLVELDEDISAVWQAMLGGDADALAARVLRFDLNRRSVAELLASEPRSTLDRAFRTLVRNRVSRGGILAAHSGVLSRGERDRGLGSRWNPHGLARRILTIGALRERIEFGSGDGLDELARHAEDSDAAALVDPPYTVGGERAGRRLYRHFEVAHERVFALAAQMRGHVLLTYDSNPATHALALRHGFDSRSVTVTTTHHRRTTELLIARDLGWLRLADTPPENATGRHVLTRRPVASDAPVKLAHPMTERAVPEGCVTVDEAAGRLGVTRRTVERLAGRGQLDRHRAGNRRAYITETSLRAALAQRGAPRPKPTGADLVSALAGIERLVAELRGDRRALLQALAEREAVRLELAELRVELERERAKRKNAERALRRDRAPLSTAATA